MLSVTHPIVVANHGGIDGTSPLSRFGEHSSFLDLALHLRPFLTVNSARQFAESGNDADGTDYR